MFKRFVVITAVTGLLALTQVHAEGPKNLRIVSSQKIITRTIPQQFQTPTDSDCVGASVWLLSEVIREKAQYVHVLRSGENPIVGTFSVEDLLEMVEY